jgi:recombination protein RecT
MGEIITAEARGDQIGAYLARDRKKLERALQNAVPFESYLTAAMSSIRNNDRLLQCSNASLMNSLLQAAQLQLVVGDARGHAYLVPYKSECTFILGYRGMLELARRSGRVRKVDARTVHQGDHFDWGFGFEPYIDHKPKLGEKKTSANLIAVYAVATLDDGTHQVDVLDPHEIEAARMRSQSGKNNNGPWGSDYLEMARKTAVRRLCKYLPLSLEAQQAIGEDEARDERPRDVVPENAEPKTNTNLQSLTQSLQGGGGDVDDDEPWPGGPEIVGDSDVEEAEYAEVEEKPKRKVAKKKAARKAAPASMPKPEPEPEPEGGELDPFEVLPWSDEEANGGYLIDVNGEYDGWLSWRDDEVAYSSPALRGKTWLQVAQGDTGSAEKAELIKVVHAAVKAGMADAPMTQRASIVIGFLDYRSAM